MTGTYKKLWRNEYVQSVLIIGLIVLAVFGFWFGVQIALNTPYPALAVVSGSMCILEDGYCGGWTHPFDRTLHVGDLIIIQGVNPADLNADYPNSDIIVFHKPTNPDELIVHRIVKREVSENGTICFITKGDGNSNKKWPEMPEITDKESWGTVPQDLVVGKVIMRVPWVGHVILFMHTSIGLPIIIAFIVMLILVEFILPIFRKRPEQIGIEKDLTQQPS